MSAHWQVATWIGALLCFFFAGASYSGARAGLAMRCTIAIIFSIAFTLLLTSVFTFALTGGGFDDAFWYHLRNSKSGIPAGELFAGGGWATVASGVLMLASISLVRSLFNLRLAGRWTIALLCFSIALSPLSGSALRQLKFASRGQVTPPEDYQSYASYRIPAVKKNLVLIYAESLERTYFDEERFPDLVPNLKRLAKAGLDFTDLRQVPSQAYTLAGLVASQTGVPFVVPSVRLGNAMSGADMFYPGAEGFGRVLNRSGYRLVYLGGADRRFAGKDKFLQQNGYDEVLGLNELSHLKGDDPADGWGLHDDTLLRIAKEKLVALSASKQPYVLTLLTLDTHFPNGRVAPSLSGLVYRDGSNPMLNAVHAADVLLSEFISEVKNTDKYGQTVIVLMSDHLSMLNSATALLNRGERRNMMLIFDCDGSRGLVNHAGTILDAAPTIMGRLGYGGRFGLGRDVLVEPRRASVVEAMVSPGYFENFDSFFQAMWEFPKFTGQVKYDPNTGRIGIGQRHFRTPVLCEIDDSGSTRFYFEFDTYKPTASISKIFDEQSRGERFFFVGEWEAAPASLKPGKVFSASDSVIIWGRVGDHANVQLLDNKETVELNLGSLMR